MSAGQRIKADYPPWLNQGWGALGGGGGGISRKWEREDVWAILWGDLGTWGGDKEMTILWLN